MSARLDARVSIALDETQELFDFVVLNLLEGYFEIGRGQPRARCKEKGYQHVTWIPIAVDCTRATQAEQYLIDRYSNHPAYNPDAARDARGSCPDRGTQFLYIVWDGDPMPKELVYTVR
jgi:hypothetical protein